MIDYTKPIEYIDGSPAHYLGRNPINNEHVVTPRGRPQARSGNFYADNGDHISNAYMSIRNVDTIQAAITLLTDNNYTVTPPPPSQALRDAVADIVSVFGFDSTSELIRQGHFADKIHKIKEMFPDLTFDICCFDEGWNFAGRTVDGQFVTCEATAQDYEAVYGYPYEQEEEVE